jgi:putative ABC transport system ATP-binding protein
VPAAPAYIRIRGLRFRYPATGHDALVLPSLEVDQPGLIAITGPSGAGKSTLIELLAGTLNERYSGSAQVLGQEWSELRGDRPRQFHLRRIALIPQDLGLLPNQTPRQMLQQAMLDAGVARAECDDRMARALGDVELTGFADRRIAELSGGQKQRVAIARALVRNVELILADEPTANLHAELADGTLAVLRRIAATVPVLMVTHDPRMAERCDRSIVLSAPPAASAVIPAGAATLGGPRAVAAAGLGSAGLGGGGRSQDRVSAEAAALPPMLSFADFGGPAGTAPPRVPRVPVARSPRVRPAPAPAPAARLAPEVGRCVVMQSMRKRSVLFASAAVCGVAAILGVFLLRPGGGTPAASKQTATAAAPAAPQPTPAASSVAAALPPAAPAAPATTAPVAVHAAPAVRTTTTAVKPPVVQATTSNPVTVSNLPMPVASPTPAVVPSPAATPLAPFQQWMALFSRYGSTGWTGGTTAPTPVPSPAAVSG